MPEFSVIIPCYRQAHLLPKAIESALAQARDVDLEVIVVDDGSPDNASEVASRYEGVIVIRQPNAGLCAARNRGILRSSGRYLLFLDSDDYLRPGMLAAAARAFAQSPDLDVVHGLADVVDEGGEKVIGEFGGQELAGDALHTLLRKNIGPPNTFVVRREMLSQVGLFDVGLRSCEDWDLWLRIAARGGKFALARDMRSVYRMVPGSMSKNVETMWRTGRAVIGRNACAHANCRACAEARRAGMAGFSLSMRPLLRDLIRSPGGKSRAAGILLRNPSLVGWQLRRVLRIDR
ncbi:Glycosyltransferase involved in cell wall bisynthesis [Variovorax sp. HW608]|uniref:glycosyltransferase n=1 Tax=Variovorax sp. HW608 TaxID=1034889 RepID=UPI00081FDD55|nr:glycosyltransferase [Variovorax sp. HW608]SCK42523.1 Glycosyltransferase involved in cell wall bisynthesis [Variovorax sp. HW608]